MSVDFLLDRDGRSCLFDTVTGIAFGPVFERQVGADEVADYCTVYLKKDPRTMTVDELRAVYDEVNDLSSDEYNRRVGD